MNSCRRRSNLPVLCSSHCDLNIFNESSWDLLVPLRTECISEWMGQGMEVGEMKLEVFVNKGECSNTASFSCFDGFGKLRQQIYRICSVHCWLAWESRKSRLHLLLKSQAGKPAQTFNTRLLIAVTQKKKPQAARNQCGFPLSVTCWGRRVSPAFTYQPHLLPWALQFVRGSCGV